MSQKLRLTYFPVRGRGEIIRYILNVTGVPYEEKTIDFQQWPALKHKTIMAHVPFIEVDGKILGETLAICRYLAKQHGLYPKTAWDQAVADMYVDGANDMWPASFAVYKPLRFEHNLQKANEEFIKFKAETLKPFMTRYTGFLATNNTGWLVGNEVSWADLYVAEALDRFNEDFPDVFDGFPELKTHRDRVHALPGLREYIAKRKPWPTPPTIDPRPR